MAWEACIRSLVGDEVFPPEQVAELRETLHQAPTNFGLNLSRWSLEAIRQVCPWLSHYTSSGIWRILRALRIHSKRGQQHVHSPDPDYVGKRDRAESTIPVSLISRIPSRGGSHAAGSWAWEPALLQNGGLLRLSRSRFKAVRV
jgi:hypothetical protein